MQLNPCALAAALDISRPGGARDAHVSTPYTPLPELRRNATCLRSQRQSVQGHLSVLNVAALALLGLSGTASGQTTEPGWEFDTSTLVYSETDGRVQAVEPKLRATRYGQDGRILTGAVTVDVLTGASPNGAAPASTPQTFSRPSGNGQYSAAPGETPLDDTFKDTRVALDGAYTLPLGTRNTLTLSANASNEYDYSSFGGGATFTREFNLKNTTVSLGANVASDSIDPEGGIPVGLSRVPGPGEPTGRAEGGDSKTITDLLASVTQVLSPESLAVFSYSMSLSDGYQTDPYKLLSVVGSDGEPLRYAYELRPDQRTKHAVYGQYKRFVFERDVWDISLRLMTDDWGIVSQTLDSTYRWNFADNRYLEPHLRYYRQGEADFYRAALFDGEENTLPFASADQRLGQFDALTLGIKYGQTLRSGNSWSLRLEGYTQLGKTAGVPEQAAAGLAKFDLEPELSAVMLTAGYRFRW